MSEKLQADWDCNLQQMYIHAPGLTSGVRVTRAPTGADLKWSTSKNGYLDDDRGKGFKKPPYTYSATGYESSDGSKKRKNCPHTAGNFFNLSYFPSHSEASGDDESMIQREFQLIVPRYAVINEYIHYDTSILNGDWQHANILPLLDDNAQRKAIGAWLFQSSPRVLSVIARERSSQEDSDFLIGYELFLDGIPGEREEEDIGEITQEGDAEEIEGKVREKKEIAIERVADAGKVVIEVEVSMKVKSGRGKHEGARGRPVRLISDIGPINGVTGSAAFLLTNSVEENLFHMLVPRGAIIEHYTHSSKSILDGPWTHVGILPSPSDIPGTQITAVAFVQSSQGKFEVVARVMPPVAGGSYLVGYELDAVNNPKGWSPAFSFVSDTGPIDKVTGSPIIIQSDFGEEDRFDLLVPRGTVTEHYIQPLGSIGEGQLRHFATLHPFQNLQVTAVSLVQNHVGSFEAITRVMGPQGDESVIGYELKQEAIQWSDGVALTADDGPILAGKPTPPVESLSERDDSQEIG